VENLLGAPTLCARIGLNAERGAHRALGASRSRGLKLSMKPFSQGLPRSM
jgi:hypothetical protein